MAKTTKLSVHRNTKARLHRKEMQKHMVNAAKAIGKQDVRAFAIVAISADGAFHSEWDTGSILPLWAFAPTIADGLRGSVEDSGADETWTPELSERPKTD